MGIIVIHHLETILIIILIIHSILSIISSHMRNNMLNTSLLHENNGKQINEPKSNDKLKKENSSIIRDYIHLERIDSVQVIEDEENQDN